MNQLACRQFGIAELTPETLGVLEGNPLFSIDHPAVAGVDALGNPTQAIADLHQDISTKLGLATQQDEYDFPGFGRSWHRDGIFIVDNQDNYCLYTTVRNVSVFCAATILDEVGSFYHIPRGGGNSVRDMTAVAKSLQEQLAIGAVSKAVSSPRRTIVWRENRQAKRDTAHAVVAVKDTRLSYSTRWLR